MRELSRDLFVLVCFLVVLGAVIATPAVGVDGQTGADGQPTNTLSSENVTTAVFDAGGAAEMALQSSGSNVDLTIELGLLPERKGHYEVTHEYEIPSRVQRLEVTLPESATVTATDGFIRSEEGERTYRWDRTTDTPKLEYESRANRSIDETGPIAGPGQLIFVDVGDWALVSQPRVSHSWGWTGERVGFDRTTTAEEGAVGDVVAYLGDYEEYTHEAHGQTFRLVVPGAASLAEDRETLFASLAHGSDALRVGERDEEVFMVAAPTGEVEWGVRGLQTGPADMWVRDTERVADPDNVWLHEYVHTRQNYWPMEDLRWFDEATATYYAALLTFEQGHIPFEEFRNHLHVGTRDRLSSSILAQPDTWQRGADYHVGALVTGELDRRIRLATDRERSFQDVFRQLNARDEVSASDFQRLVREVGGQEVADLAEQYTRTTDRPQLWTRQQHDEAFDATPARITVAFADVDPFRVSGDYRERVLGPDRPVVLVPGETLTFDAVAHNDGGTAGEYTATLRVSGTEQASQTGSLDSDAATDLQFDHTFDTVGEYAVSIGIDEVPVSVREPAQADVTSFETARTDVRPGATVTLSAVVENEAGYPGERVLSLTRNGEDIETRTIRLDALSERTVEFGVTLDEEGTYVFGLGDIPVDALVVTVSEDEEGELASDSIDDSEERHDDSAEVANDEIVSDDAEAGPDDPDGGVGWVGIGFAALVLLVLLVGLGFWRSYGKTDAGRIDPE